MNVVARTMLFNQGVFEDQSFFFGVGDNRFNGRGPLHQKLDLRPGITLGLHITAQAGTQVFCFADIENHTGIILHQVNAGRGRLSAQIKSCHRSSLQLAKQSIILKIR